VFVFFYFLFSKRSKYGDEKEACVNLFFEENQNLLTSLLSLIQGREDENLPKQIRDCVISFTNELISENLIENLSDLIMVRLFDYL
jgi:hypothetical protein